MLHHSKYYSFGGPNINRVLVSNATSAVTIDDLVVLDRTGIPIYFLASTDYLPEFPFPTVARIQLNLKNATDEYYKRNVIFGCQDSDAENFNYNANVDDSTCRMPFNNYTFGGVFQKCTVIQGNSDVCKDLELKNGITGQFTCPAGPGKYVPLKLFQTSHVSFTEQNL